MHFANANMFLHANALEIFSQTYESLRSLNFETEFGEAEKNQLKAILKAKNIGLVLSALTEPIQNN